MDLRISSQPARIGIRSTPGRLEIDQAPADMKIHSGEAVLSIHAGAAKLDIDQSQCFAETGQKNIFRLIQEYAQMGKQKAAQGTMKTAAQGDQLADIHRGGNIIASQGAQNAFSGDNLDYNIAMVPKSRPQITITPGDLNIDVQQGKVDVQIQAHPPNTHYTPGKVQVYLKQKNYLQIQYVGKQLDVAAG